RPQPPSPADREAAGCPLPPGRRHSIGHDESSSLPPRSLPDNKCQPVAAASGGGSGPTHQLPDLPPVLAVTSMPPIVIVRSTPLSMSNKVRQATETAVSASI